MLFLICFGIWAALFGAGFLVIYVLNWRYLAQVKRITLPPWLPFDGTRHRHGLADLSWTEHDHLGGGAPHTHDPETGFQVELPMPAESQEDVLECSCYYSDGGPYGLPHVVTCHNCDDYFKEHGAWPSWGRY